MLLINPPVVKPSEPPAGIAKLAGVLAANNIPCWVLDANIEGLLFLAGHPGPASDTWGRRAIKNGPDNLSALRDPATFRSLDRYKRAVRDVVRLLALASKGSIGLSDHQHPVLSPLRSDDLIASAERHQQDPFAAYFQERLRQMIGQGSPRMIGISLNYLSQALSAFAMIGFIRETFPGLKVVLGGGLMTSWMRRPGWNDPFAGLVDLCVAGPGEGPLLELLGVDPAKRKNGTPDYSAFPRQDYLSPGFILPYSGSSGCYWSKCSFCPETAEGNPYQPVPPAAAMEDIAALTASTAPVLLHLLDNSVSPSLMSALANEPPGVPWYGFARIGQDLADPDRSRELRRSGCVMLKLGLESGDQGVLDRLQKGIDLDTASRVLMTLKKAGIAAYVYLLFGTPEETEAEARRTLDFTIRHADAIGFLNLAVFNMPVCSHEIKGFDTARFYEGDLSLYTGFRHPHGWDRKVVRKFLDSEFKKHPAISPIVLNDPPAFTSNHAAFFSKPRRRAAVPEN
jgi:radical SAM superfamily enzyme YgiQ (UPF0313 family)